MANQFEKFLRSIIENLDINKGDKEQIVRELSDHLENSVLDYREEGLTMEHAQEKAIEKFGNPAKISRELNWVHGFGRWSTRRILDSFLGSLPFLFCLVLIFFVEIRLIPVNSYLFGLFWVLILGVSIYALRKAVPAWSIPWLGFLNVIVLQVLFVFAAVVWGQGLAGIAIVSCTLIFSTYLMAKRQPESVFLFLLPMAVPYVFFGYDEVVRSHRMFMEGLVILWAAALCFIALYTRLRWVKLIGVAGFCLYTFVYIDILRAPLVAPLKTNYLGLSPALLGYFIPLLVVLVAPGYLYFKKRRA
ncbi:MAG: permease prefix domain 1-containing protein [Acidobacteriota bacterium]